LKVQFADLDPVALLGHIDRLQDELWLYAYRERVTTVEQTESEPAAADAKRQGVFQRPSALSQHQTTCESQEATSVTGQVSSDRPQRLYRQQKNKYKGQRWWRTHPDAFTDSWDDVVQQLDQTPDLRAKELFRVIQRQYPGQFKDSQLRSFQRRVRAWRRQEATPTATKDETSSRLHQDNSSKRRVTFVEEK
jgi:hypothetical protein